MTRWHSIRRLWQTVTRRTEPFAVPLALVGLAVVAWRNWQQWQHDQQRLATFAPEPAPPPFATWQHTPSVSVLVAAWNEGAGIDAHLQALLALQYPRLEVVLCAGGSPGDDTLQRAQHYHDPRLTVLPQQAGEGKQVALYRGFAVATGDVIVLTDADCIVTDESLARLLSPLVNEGEQVTSGRSAPPVAERGRCWVQNQWAPLWYNDLGDRPRYSNGMLGRNAALRRGIVAAAWADQYPVATGTDYYLARRVLVAGERIRLVPDSIVMTGSPPTLRDYVRQRARWVANLMVIGREWNDIASVRVSLQSGVVGLGLLLLPLAMLVSRAWGGAVWLLAWGSMLLVRVRYLAVWNTAHGIPVLRGLSLTTVVLMVADMVAWTRALLVGVGLLPRRW